MSQSWSGIWGVSTLLESFCQIWRVCCVLSMTFSKKLTLEVDSGVRESAFVMSKEHLQDSPMLVLDKLKKPLRLDCDALHYGVGVVILHVMENSEENTFAFAAIIHGVTIHKLRKGSVYCVSGEDLRC